MGNVRERVFGVRVVEEITVATSDGQEIVIGEGARGVVAPKEQERPARVIFNSRIGTFPLASGFVLGDNIVELRPDEYDVL